VLEGDSMGVERAVTRWYVQRQQLLEEITLLEAMLASTSIIEQVGEEVVEQEDAEKKVAIRQQLVVAQEKLRLLGPCPKPMMG
jgi:hypothetical protein